MARFSPDQLAYARKLSGYLDRQASIDFDRFAPPGITPTIPHFATTSKASDLDEKAIERAQNGYLRDLGLTVTACNINTWTNPKFRLGGPCNPDPALRRAALEEVPLAGY